MKTQLSGIVVLGLIVILGLANATLFSKIRHPQNAEPTPTSVPGNQCWCTTGYNRPAVTFIPSPSAPTPTPPFELPPPSTSPMPSSPAPSAAASPSPQEAPATAPAGAPQKKPFTQPPPSPIATNYYNQAVQSYADSTYNKVEELYNIDDLTPIDY